MKKKKINPKIRSYIKNPEVIKEVEIISEKNGGILKPENVVDAARSKNSPLHKYFEWDDSVAAEKFRLHQARMFINVLVTIIDKKSEPVRVFMSLRKDRYGQETGYRTMVSILGDEELYKNLLNDAMEEMEYFRNKYHKLVELKEIFDAIDKVRVKIKKK